MTETSPAEHLIGLNGDRYAAAMHRTHSNEVRLGALGLMAESFGTEFTLVEVTSDDPWKPKTQTWLALAKPGQALTLVLSAVPEGWTARILPAVLTEKQVRLFQEVNLTPGGVYRITSK